MSTTRSINFNTGFKKYALNGDESNCISVNVADPNLLVRIEGAQEKFDELFSRLADVGKMQPQELADVDREIKALIDETFNADISSHAFGNTSCYAILESGELLCESFINAFMPVVIEDAEAAMEAYAKNSAEKTKAYVEAAESFEDDAE